MDELNTALLAVLHETDVISGARQKENSFLQLMFVSD